MKNILFAISLILVLNNKPLYSQSFNYDTSFVLLSSANIDYRNPQFDKSQPSVSYNIRDCIFGYEKWSSANVSNIAVRFMRYNSLLAEAELTNDLFMNKNVAVAYYTDYSTVENSKGAVVFQSNKNGNWDIFFSEYNQVSWSNPVAVTTGSDDETFPSIVAYMTNNVVNYLISYQRGDDIFVRNYFNGIWMNEINVTASEPARCFSPKLTKGNFSTGNLYLAYLRDNNSVNSISFHKNQISGAGDFVLGNKITINQPGSQSNIRFSNGFNYILLNYDYDTLGSKHFYFAAINQDNYSYYDQSRAFSGINYGGMGTTHGDITDNINDSYSFCTWIRKDNDSTQVVVSRMPNVWDLTIRKFFVGNANAETFVNASSKLVFGSPYNAYRVRVLWEKEVNGRTAIVESFRDDYLTSVSVSSNIIPDKFSLSQNYPNPFNPNTIINYQCSMFNHISIKVYDALGNEVAILVNENKAPGNYSVQFDGSNLSSGIYFYKLQTDNFSETKRMILLK